MIPVDSETFKPDRTTAYGRGAQFLFLAVPIGIFKLASDVVLEAIRSGYLSPHQFETHNILNGQNLIQTLALSTVGVVGFAWYDHIHSRRASNPSLLDTHATQRIITPEGIKTIEEP